MLSARLALLPERLHTRLPARHPQDIRSAICFRRSNAERSEVSHNGLSYRKVVMVSTGKNYGMSLTFAATLAMVALFKSDAAFAEPLGYAGPISHPAFLFGQTTREPDVANDTQTPDEIPARLHRHVVDYSTHEAPGTIVIDTPNTYLYFVLGEGKAVRYGIGVGREGFTWSGVKAIERKAEWPDWLPPAEMLQRQPYLPRFMAGGPGNPLGARAMYIGGTVYRIHGTNARPQSASKYRADASAC
jgi:lipoprotein-anchoring transpeptidase ErfK/SrfK